jgi:hypothetical protein
MLNREFKMNTLIRSYDFPSMDSEYMEGTITGSDSSGRYVCTMTKCVQRDVSIAFPEGETFSTPPLGTDLFDGIREEAGRNPRLMVLS